MKKLSILSFAVILGLSLFTRPVFADNGSSTLQKVLENTKQFLDDLVTAKDENSGNDLILRVKTFRQVLDLSQAEAKDFEFKILATDKGDKLDAWSKSAIKNFDSALSFFDSQKDLVADDKPMDLFWIKKIAQDFKSWREKNYSPLVNQTQEFLLIKQEMKSIQTAQGRLQKITNDLRGIKQSRVVNSSDVKKSLDNSRVLIGQASDLNNQAASLFAAKYMDVKNSSSTPDVSVLTNQDANSSSTATSSPADSSANLPIVSIKDLVRSSLGKIKEAYQGFIDISNLVRKLLG